MKKKDIGIHAGIIWNLLSENGPMTVREIGEKTNSKDSMIYLALGWLSRENKIIFTEKNGDTYAGLNDAFTETYY